MPCLKNSEFSDNNNLVSKFSTVFANETSRNSSTMNEKCITKLTHFLSDKDQQLTFFVRVIRESNTITISILYSVQLFLSMEHFKQKGHH